MTFISKIYYPGKKLRGKSITKTRLFKYIENFISKNWKFSDKKLLYFSYFCSKHRLWVLLRTIYVFEQKYEKYKRFFIWKFYPCKPQFYFIKVGFKGVKFIQACFRDAQEKRKSHNHEAHSSRGIERKRVEEQAMTRHNSTVAITDVQIKEKKIQRRRLL